MNEFFHWSKWSKTAIIFELTYRRRSSPFADPIFSLGMELANNLIVSFPYRFSEHCCDAFVSFSIMREENFSRIVEIMIQLKLDTFLSLTGYLQFNYFFCKFCCNYYIILY